MEPGEGINRSAGVADKARVGSRRNRPVRAGGAGVAEDRGTKDARTPRANPLHQIEIDDFRRDRLLAALALLFGAAFLGVILYLTQFNQQVFGVTASEAGLMLLPMIGGLMVSSIAVGQLVAKTGVYKYFLVAGFALATVSIYTLSFLTPESTYLNEAISMVFIGIGMGMAMQILNLAVQNEFTQKVINNIAIWFKFIFTSH